jgi:hypothetical protein
VNDALPTPWTVTAQNLPEHRRNPIHTDEGARAAGFPRALVAGVTTYAYLTHPVVAAWGTSWLENGGGEVRFRKPVFDQDTVLCEPLEKDDSVFIHAITSEPEQPRVVFEAFRSSPTVIAIRTGQVLRTMEYTLEGEHGTDRGLLAGEDLPLYREHNLVHPAVWPTLANDVVHTQIATGSWVHTRSIIRHHALVHAGAMCRIESAIVDRFNAGGERVVLDLHFIVDNTVVTSIEHEAIIKLP